MLSATFARGVLTLGPEKTTRSQTQSTPAPNRMIALGGSNTPIRTEGMSAFACSSQRTCSSPPIAIECPVRVCLCLGAPSALSRAPHRTGALAHGLADILADQAGSRARGRRTETAQTGCRRMRGTTTGSACRGPDRPPPGANGSLCHADALLGLSRTGTAAVRTTERRPLQFRARS